jgi:hypothetical protein
VGTPEPGRNQLLNRSARSGQSGFGVLGQTVQLEVESGIQLLLGRCPQLGDLVLEFLDSTSQAYYLESESLF